MTSVAEYHQAVKARLIADPLIVRFEIRRERLSVDDGHLRACLMLHNGDQLEFSEAGRDCRHHRIHGPLTSLSILSAASPRVGSPTVS